MQLKEQLFQTTQERFGCSPDQCDDRQLYEALLLLTRQLAQNRPAPPGTGSSTISLRNSSWASC